jgi:hypothetical protein
MNKTKSFVYFIPAYYFSCSSVREYIISRDSVINKRHKLNIFVNAIRITLQYGCLIFKINFCLCDMLRKGSDVMLLSTQR